MSKVAPCPQHGYCPSCAAVYAANTAARVEQRQQVQLTEISDAINDRVKGWLVKVLEQITQMKQTSQNHSAAMCGFKEQLTALTSFLQAVQKSAAEEKAARDAQDADVTQQLADLRREMAELKRAQQHQHQPVGTMPVPSAVVDAHPNPSWTSLLDNLTDAVSFGQGSGMNGGLLPHDPSAMWQQQQQQQQQGPPQQQHGVEVEHLSAMMSGYDDGAEEPSAVDYEAETGYVAEAHADAVAEAEIAAAAAAATAAAAASPAREAASAENAAAPVVAAAEEHDRAPQDDVENTAVAADSECGSAASPRAGSAVAAAAPAQQQKQQTEKEQDKKATTSVPPTTAAATATAVPPQPKAAPAAAKSAKEAKEPPAAAGNTSPSFRNVAAGAAPPTAAAVVAAAAATTQAEPKAKAEPPLTKKERKAAAAAAAAAAKQQPQQTASSSSPKSAAAGSAAAASAAAGPAAKSDDAQAREEAIEQAKSKMSPGSMFAVIELTKEPHQKYGITRVDGSITNVDDAPPAIAYRAGVRKGMTVLSMAELSGENTRLYCLGIVAEETCLKGTFREKLDSHKMKGNAGVVHLQYTLYAKNHQSGETRDFRTLLVSSEEAAGLTDGQAVDAAAFSHTRSADKMYVNATDVAPDHTPVSNPTVSWVNGPPATVSAPAARPQAAAATAATASDAVSRVVAAVKAGSSAATPHSGMPVAGKQQFEQREVRCKFTIIKGAGAKTFGLRTSGGVVTEVQRNGPAAKAGVREGMEVMEGGREESGNKMILWTNLHQCSTKVTGLVDPLFNEERQCGEVELRSFLYLHEKPEKKAIVNTPEATEKHGRRSVKPGVRLRRNDRVEFEFNVGFNPRERREMLYVVGCEVRRDN